MMSPLEFITQYFEFSVSRAMSSMSVRVLMMAPAAPPSKHWRIRSGLLVVSSDAMITGFLNVTPQKSTRMSAIHPSRDDSSFPRNLMRDY
jgi:hypothetical protein